MLNVFEYVFPIVAGPAPGEVQIAVGTAFSIGGDRFMTAGHCLTEGLSFKWTALGTAQGEEWKFSQIAEAEIDDDHDIGLFHVELPAYRAFRWTAEEFHMAEQVHSVGYAHAFEPDRLALGIRTFSGHVVSSKKFHQLSSNPGIYELSFPCPRGLSGAPVFSPGGDPRMCGVVIGNTSIEMEVLRSREIVKERTELIVERYETLQLGIAIRATSILQVDSPKILSGSVEAHLRKHGVLL